MIYHTRKPNPITRICIDCHQEQSLDEFVKLPHVGGYTRRCKPCHKKHMKEVRTKPHRRKKPVVQGFVYFVYAKEVSRIKIGWSQRDAKYRIKTMATDCPCDLSLIVQVKGSRIDEREYHKKFHYINHHGEWFEATKELLDFIGCL